MKKLIIINTILILIYTIIPETPKPILENKEIKQDSISQKVITSNREFERKKSEEIKEISQKGINLIKKYEGCKLTAYKLSGEKHYTIGYGHFGAEIKRRTTNYTTRSGKPFKNRFKTL